FDFLCSDETSGGFCCLRDIKTSSCFHCLLITERCDCCSALSRRYLSERGHRDLGALSSIGCMLGKVIRQQRYAPALPPRSLCVERPVTAARWRAGLRTAAYRHRRFSNRAEAASQEIGEIRRYQLVSDLRRSGPD